MKKFRLSRRAVLRGIGTGLALPPLEAMFDSRGNQYGGNSALAAAGDPLKYFVTFHWPFGLPPQGDRSDDTTANFWFPIKKNQNTNIEDLTTSPDGLRPLLEDGKFGNFRQDINVIAGLTMRNIGEHLIGSHGHASETFNGYRAAPDPKLPTEPMGPVASVDQIASLALANKSSLYVKLDEGGDHWEWSTVGPSQPNTNYRRPTALWNKLFEMANLPPDQQAAILNRKKSMIDYIRRDASRLKTKLGKADQKRLDTHLEVVRLLEQNVLATVTLPTTCSISSKPNDDSYGPWATEGGAAKADDSKTNYDNFDGYTNLMIDLVTLGMACGITQSVLFSTGESQNNDGKYQHVPGGVNYYETVPGGNPHPWSMHDVQHGGGGGTPEGIAQMKNVIKWQMEKVAYFLKRMKDFGAGTPAGSLLDNSVFIALSEFVCGAEHFNNFLPVIVAGKAKPMTTGKYIAFRNHWHFLYDNGPYVNWNNIPSWARNLPLIANNKTFGQEGGEDQNAVCLNDLWQHGLQAVGAYTSGSQKFGDQGLWNSGTLPYLWSV